MIIAEKVWYSFTHENRRLIFLFSAMTLLLSGLWILSGSVLFHDIDINVFVTPK